MNLNIEKNVTPDFITEFSDIFSGLGCIKGFTYDIDLVEEAKGSQRLARNVPYHLREEVKKTLDEMVSTGVIRKVDIPTKYCSQMVAVRQHDKIRICIDPTDLNKDIIRRRYPMRTFEEIAAQVNGSKYLRTFDYNTAFTQIKHSEWSQLLTTFATPWSRYC